MAWLAPNGMNMPDWTPTTAGMGWTSTPILAPLEPIRNKVLIVTGLDHEAIAVPEPSPTGNPPGPYAAGTGCFLNMVPVDGHDATDPTRISLDQALLPVLNSADCGAPPSLTSISIGLGGDNIICDYADCAFTRALSWNSGMVLPAIYDPALLFDAMFAPGNDIAARRAIAQRKSILDSVLAEARSLSVKLSPSDRLKLDEHTTLVRNLETRLQRTGKSRVAVPSGAGDEACMPARPGPLPLGPLTLSSLFEYDFRLFVDLMAVAFQCDITRAITFRIGADSDYAFLVGGRPYTAPHRTLSASGSDLAALTKIDAYEITQAAALLQKLDSVVEADGQTVLDHTTFYLGSDIADGVAKNHWDMPVILAGGASGGLKVDGRHVNYIPQLPFPRPLVGPRNPNQNTGQVFISILHAHGILQDTFGLATGGPLSELMP